MSLSSKIAVLGAVLLTLSLGACSKKKVEVKGLYFSGPCKVSVKSEPSDSEIFIDGISVGNGIASVEIPCGEKQIMVKKKGFETHKDYAVVNKGTALSLEVSLNAVSKSHDNFALSDDFVDQVGQGLPVHDPHHGGEAPELKEGEYPKYMGDMASLIASVKGTKGSKGASEVVLETGPWESVEDWR